MEFKKVENDIVPIYENETKDKLINARELHNALGSKRQFADWIKQRIERYRFIENTDFIKHHCDGWKFKTTSNRLLFIYRHGKRAMYDRKQ